MPGGFVQILPLGRLRIYRQKKTPLSGARGNYYSEMSIAVSSVWTSFADLAAKGCFTYMELLAIMADMSALTFAAVTLLLTYLKFIDVVPVSVTKLIESLLTTAIFRHLLFLDEASCNFFYTVELLTIAIF